ATLRAPLCAGIDPDPRLLPDGMDATAPGIERYARELVAAVLPHVVAVKLNVAFFEAFGSAGWAALERVRGDVPRDVVCVIDAKRGDIATSADRYAEGLLGSLHADAVTLSPYLGEDAIEPFVNHASRPIVYVLARTSNPSARSLQDASVAGRPLYERVAEWVADRWPGGGVGLVVGATAPDELRRVRAIAPDLPFLIPGVGAQGGDAAAAVAVCHGRAAPGIVSISRAIAEPAAGAGPDWARAVGRAAESWRARMLEAGATLGA
ncbi:MAG: orotidine-5'-phosphate decarboxylase, partial [Chloroflexota bacterium]|nr:orotidine-5'-phosphate decarboxylase [Chloroflexota bacterium]